MKPSIRLYRESDSKRELLIVPAKGFSVEEYRTPWRRDYARLIHSPAFRRLNGKTQLYPGSESDFFRNRLTHSLEVAQIAKSIAIKLNHQLTKTVYKKFRIEPDIVEFAGLAHDLGHPPFGHLGEQALDKLMEDFGGFEGNAQSLRILARLEKRHFVKLKDGDSRCGIGDNDEDLRLGLNLTYRSLASILKYDFEIPDSLVKREQFSQKGLINNPHHPIKGYYESEGNLVRNIKKAVLGGDIPGIKFKTLECQIMDIADDIAYSTYDLEDAFKAGFMTPLKILASRDSLLDQVAMRASKNLNKTVTRDAVVNVFYDLFNDLLRIDEQAQIDVPPENMMEVATELLPAMLMRKAAWASEVLAKDGYDRTGFTSRLVGKFIREIDWDNIDEIHPALSTIKMSPDQHLKLEVLKQMNFVSQIDSPRLRIVEIRGKDIVSRIFETLATPDGAKLLPRDCHEIYSKFTTERMKKRTICDFIAGMTDRYAIEFYGRLTSETPETIFKPL